MKFACLAWRTLLVYTAKNLASFGSYELSLNFFFSGCKTKIKLKYKKYGSKWDYFLTARAQSNHAYCRGTQRQLSVRRRFAV